MSLSFLVDGMLGSLNRWLRICGYETEFYRNASDEKLLEISKEKGHIVLTRDRNLSREARRSGVEAFIVLGKNIDEMLVSVAKEFGLILNPAMARCTTCGSMLNEVPKHNVDGEVPPSSYAVYKKILEMHELWKGVLERKPLEEDLRKDFHGLYTNE